MKSNLGVRLAVIGLNHGLKMAHRISKLDGANLAAVCAPYLDNYIEIAAEIGVPYYRNVRDMLTQEELDGVIIATPTHLLAKTAIECASYGLHLLVEKPIAVSLEEGYELVEAAARNKVRLLAGYHRRYSPFVRKLRDIIISGGIGKLIGVNCVWAALKPFDYFQKSWRIDPQLGGGPLMINAVHEIDTLRFVCGEIHKVCAQISSIHASQQVENTVALSLTFWEGAVASLFFSDCTPSPYSYEACVHENSEIHPYDSNCYFFFGSKGSIAFPRMELSYYSQNSHQGWSHPLNLAKELVAPADPLEAELHHFVQVIQGKEFPFISGEDALQTLAVVQAAKKAAIGGYCIDVRKI